MSSCHIPIVGNKLSPSQPPTSTTTVPIPPSDNIQHKHKCSEADFPLPPSSAPLPHPSTLTSTEDGDSDAVLASAAPPLKGHTCPLSQWLFSTETIDDNEPMKIRYSRNESHDPTTLQRPVSLCACGVCLRAIQLVCVLVCVFIYCRSLLLLLSYILPDNTEGSEHAQ